MPPNDDGEELGGSSMSIEDFEKDALEAAKPDDESNRPEAYRGKTIDEIIAIAETARSTMNESVTAATKAAESAAAIAASMGQQREAPIEQPKELTREEIKALYDEDPMAALEVIQQQAERRISNHFEARIAPLTAGTMGAAENWARQEYSEEFELFGGDIQKMIDSIPNKQVFSNKKGWEDAISYVRGQKGNFEKLMEHKTSKRNSSDGSEARGRERESAGFSGRSTVTASSRRESRAPTEGMSSDQQRIAQSFIDNGTFKDMAEYNKWQRMGG